MPGNRRIFIPTALIIAVVIAVGGVVFLRNRPVTLRGAVIQNSNDPNKETPIAGVDILATDGAAKVTAKSGISGGFEVTVRRALMRRHSLTLSFRHPGYKPFSIVDPAGDLMYIAKLVPIPVESVHADVPTIHIASVSVSVRYTAKTPSTVDIGSKVKTFEISNKGNVPCKGDQKCSPDGRWKAGVATASLDAGPDNQFRNGRVSCIAGPCPFTAISHDGFSQGGRVIDVTVVNWSDTTTFLIQAEAVRNVLSDSIRKSYPVIFERTMTFTLPASSEGTCIEAEIEGTPIVFPINPNLSLSWADCETQADSKNTRLFRCELKPGYAFR